MQVGINCRLCTHMGENEFSVELTCKQIEEVTNYYGTNTIRSFDTIKQCREIYMQQIPLLSIMDPWD